MCRVSDQLAERSAAAAALRDACMVHIKDPMTVILDRGSVLDLNVPFEMAALLRKMPIEGETK